MLQSDHVLRQQFKIYAAECWRRMAHFWVEKFDKENAKNCQGCYLFLRQQALS